MVVLCIFNLSLGQGGIVDGLIPLLSLRFFVLQAVYGHCL